MKILVAIKHVPDTEAKIRVAGDGVSLDGSGVKLDISPYDEYAIEEALRIREAAGEGEVVLVSAGPLAAKSSLQKGLAMGADRAALIEDPRYDRADGLARARALAAVATAEAPRLILLGKYGVGTDEGQTGPMLAELLSLPHAGGVSQLELQDDGFRARRDVEGAVEVIEGRLPALITTEKGINEPRYPSLKGIMAAKKKPLEIKPPTEWGIDTADLDQPRVVWESMDLPAARSAGQLVDGDADQQVAELVRLLHEEAKVI